MQAARWRPMPRQPGSKPTCSCRRMCRSRIVSRSKLPDAILYPTGGGVGLIGMWKAFEEMEALGWIDAGKRPRPKMICVQAEGCAPIPKALQDGEGASKMWPDAHTLAAGLRVPKAYGDDIILDSVRKSGGTAIAVSDDA